MVHPLDSLLWYVTGSLDEQKTKEVKAHLDTCDKCTKEIAFLKMVQQETMASASEAPEPGMLLLPKIMKEIKKHPKHKVSRLQKMASIAAAIVIVLQGGYIASSFTDKDKQFTLMGEGVATLKIRFIPNAKISGVNSFLDKLKGRIVAGPDADNYYQIRVDSLLKKSSSQLWQQTISNIKQKKKIIEYVERN